MATAEYVLGSRTDMDRYVRLMTAANGAKGIVNVVSGYLAGWSTDRIENLQRVDGGWGPFDDCQQPVQLSTVADVSRICDSVRGQCVALKEAGIAPTPEFLELDLFLFFARQVIEDHVPARSRSYTAPANDGGYKHWSDSREFGSSL